MWWPGVIKAIHLGYGDIARQASTSKPQATSFYFLKNPGGSRPQALLWVGPAHMLFSDLRHSVAATICPALKCFLTRYLCNSVAHKQQVR